MDPSTILTSVGTTLLTNFVSDKDAGPLRTLNDVWDIALGGFINGIAEKRRAKYAANVELYKEALVKDVSSIPLENLKEPPLSIIGPALETAKYYIEEEELRSMFAKLVASSMDNRKSRDVHPSFIEIIKQLSPLDAQVFATFNVVREISQPIVNFCYQNKGENLIIFCRDVYMRKEFEGFGNEKLLLDSIQNLKRLGLVDISYENLNRYETDLFDYSQFKQHHRYEFWGVDNIIMQKGVITPTILGRSFASVCLQYVPDPEESDIDLPDSLL